MKVSLEVVKTTEELENFLKVKYVLAGTASRKNRNSSHNKVVSQPKFAHRTVAQDREKSKIVSKDIGSQEVKHGQSTEQIPGEINHDDSASKRKSNQNILEILKIPGPTLETSRIDETHKSTIIDRKPYGINFLANKIGLNKASTDTIQSSLQSWSDLPASLDRKLETSHIGRTVASDHTTLSKEEPSNKKSTIVSAWNPMMNPYWFLMKQRTYPLRFEQKNKGKIVGSAGSNVHSARNPNVPFKSPGNATDRPGRPPSYDGMVHWCVQLKRLLCQKNVPLTIDEALALVNNPAIYQVDCSPGEHFRPRSLVASTLRKRVLGIYNLTWSQISTDIDPDGSKPITDPCVLAAAAMIYDQHGLDMMGNVPALQDQVAEETKVKETPESQSEENIHKYDELEDGNKHDSHTPFGQDMSAQKAEEMKNLIISLEDSLPNISDSCRSLISRGKQDFLCADDIFELLEEAAEGRIPISKRVHLPLSGDIFIFDRTMTPKFRCDGLEWRRKETHAKRKLKNGFKLNCYYATGTGNLQRRCYWVLDTVSSRLSNLVLVHYLRPSSKSQVDAFPLGRPQSESNTCYDGNNDTIKEILLKFQDANDGDSMFEALCLLHKIQGIDKQRCAKLCHFWTRSCLDDTQKKQIFVYIRNNLDDVESVHQWIDLTSNSLNLK